MSSSTADDPAIFGYAAEHTTSSSFDTGMRIEPKSIYMLLWRQDTPARFHWAIMASLTDRFGLIYHQARLGEDWKFIQEGKDVSRSHNLLLAMKLGDISDDPHEWIERAKKCMKETKVVGEFTCRTWALEAVYDLARAGILDANIDRATLYKFEEEAKAYARLCRRVNTKRTVSSRYITVDSVRCYLWKRRYNTGVANDNTAASRYVFGLWTVPIESLIDSIRQH